MTIRHHDHHHDHHGSEAADEAAMAELLDLDAQVLPGYLSEVTAWVAELAGDRDCRRILDVGAGTGTGTVALLERFAAAQATALDLSAGMLERLRDRAARAGLGDRVRTVQANLDEAWPALDPVDLVWASSSLHHMADPGRALSEVFGLLRPGGLLVVTEVEGFPRFLPDDLGLGRLGLETRLRAASEQERAERLPHLGADWAGHLSRAGLDLVAGRTFAIDLAPAPAGAGRYAQVCLGRIRAALADRIDAGDLATLDVLLDGERPESVLHRGDLTVRHTRTGWITRRP